MVVLQNDAHVAVDELTGAVEQMRAPSRRIVPEVAHLAYEPNHRRYFVQGNVHKGLIICFGTMAMGIRRKDGFRWRAISNRSTTFIMAAPHCREIRCLAVFGENLFLRIPAV